jgi:Macrocin-O-methyltransferase (TylF).
MNPIQGLMRRLNAAGLSADARRIRDERLTYLTPEKLNRLEGTLREILRAGVPGDVLEFGVALGGSAVLLAKQAKAAGRRFAGFDVFAMIPPPTSEKDDEKSKQRYETIASGQSKGIGGDDYYGYRDDLYGDVVATFSRHGLTVDGREIALVKGLFEETWPREGSQTVAFAHIDCDWYDPVKFCLESVAQRLSTGGVMILDDYNDYGGCRTATDEFISANPGFRFEPGVNPIVRKVAN